jgi:tetratricopeptide (TPR) repeat protein
MSIRSGILAMVVVGVLALPASPQSIGRARRAIEQMQYERAQEQLVEIAKRERGEDKQEALFLLAGLKSSVSEAEIIYEEVVRVDPSSVWADRATLEMAKIQYALGNYGESFNMLRQSHACRDSEEACFFEGLSAIMLQRYDDARSPLSRIRGGKYQPWAMLSLAEVDVHDDNGESACDRYQSMSRASISPTAMYRYAECLEKRGSTARARRVFADIIDEFPGTPEAVLAEEKLSVVGARREEEPRRSEEASPEPPRTSGFTLQFGAFSDRANAIRLAAQLKQRVPGVRIDSGLVNHREIHRVRFGYFATREEAVRRGEKLSREVDEPFTIMILP